jgi:glycyl-tRNA synthetase beta chain
MPDFLFEIGVEEIPARMIDSARDELARRTGNLLVRERLADTPAVEAYSTPRRLAVMAQGIALRQPDVQEQLTGPSLKVAYKDGAPTQAAEAFARKAGIPVASLEQVTTAKGEYLAATVQRKGRAASEILAELLPKEIAGIYWAKSMYWRGKNAERFVRPLRWMVTLLDDQVVPVEFGGVTAGHISQGHRILSRDAVIIDRPSDYSEKLGQAFVTVSAAERHHRIRKALDAATRTVSGARWREDMALLDTVVNLTECPSVIIGSFDPDFLTLPQEVLVTVMRDHQKYFAIEDADGRLLPHFLAVLNTDSDPDGLVRHGNERVLRARFNDARFFWNTDQKINLRERVEMLKAVTFQKDLGSYFEKTSRVQKLSSLVSEVLRVADVAIRPGVVFKAAHLSKADLTTELVKEFTELQGIVGGLYAKVQQLDPSLPHATAEAIGEAIYHHYQPESMDDDVPPTLEGAVLAISDKADTIAGMFALGFEPSGSKDPFALRRAANGIVKIIADHKLPIPVAKLFADARTQYSGSNAERRFDKKVDFEASVSGFLRERLEFYLKDVRGFAYDVVNAVLAAGRDDVVDAIARAEALTEVRRSDDFASISVAFKRTKNILRQAREAAKQISDQLDPSACTEESEKSLATAVPEIAAKVASLRAQKNYTAALTEISRLRPAIDLFFDKVMVMVDDERVRANRLALLQTLLAEFSTIADFSEIVADAKSS